MGAGVLSTQQKMKKQWVTRGTDNFQEKFSLILRGKVKWNRNF